MIFRLGLATLLAFWPLAASADDHIADFAGHYEMAGTVAKRYFKLDLTQKGSRVHVVFAAADLNQDDGLKPTGEGDGHVDDDGVLKFTFKDNLKNAANATLTPSGNVYRFEIRPTKVVDMAPLHFYGVMTMRKTSGPPSATVSAR